MFEKLFKKVKSFDDAMQQVQQTEEVPIITVCKYESQNNDCSLLHLLKDKQAQKEFLEEEIKKISDEKKGQITENTKVICKFLKALNRTGILRFFNDNYHWYKADDTFDTYCSMYDFPERIEASIQFLTSEDIENISKELADIKKYKENIAQKEQNVLLLKKEIIDIKRQLGVE